MSKNPLEPDWEGSLGPILPSSGSPAQDPEPDATTLPIQPGEDVPIIQGGVTLGSIKFNDLPAQNAAAVREELRLAEQADAAIRADAIHTDEAIRRMDTRFTVDFFEFNSETEIINLILNLGAECTVEELQWPVQAAKALASIVLHLSGPNIVGMSTYKDYVDAIHFLWDRNIVTFNVGARLLQGVALVAP
jgi:hypothetical protein